MFNDPLYTSLHPFLLSSVVIRDPMAAPPPPNPPAIALPAQPNDLNVLLPAAPVFPPTVNDVLAAVRYRRDVELSIGM
jgi:hypothetical protein